MFACNFQNPLSTEQRDISKLCPGLWYLRGRLKKENCWVCAEINNAKKRARMINYKLSHNISTAFFPALLLESWYIGQLYDFCPKMSVLIQRKEERVGKEGGMEGERDWEQATKEDNLG